MTEPDLFKSDNDGYKKPGWDSRQEYSKIIGQAIKAILNSQYYEEYNSWITLLYSYLSLTKGAMKEADYTTVKTELDKIKTLHHNLIINQTLAKLSNVERYKLNDKLTNTQSTIFEKTIHLLVPLKGDEDVGDVEQILKRESNI